MKKINKNVLKLINSASMQQAEMVRRLKAKGQNVIDLTCGEPCFTTDENIIECAYSAMRDGKTKYTTSYGIPELRNLIAKQQSVENDLNYDPEKEIIITPGAKQAVFYALSGIINPGDEIILFEPYWLSYRDIITFLGGKVVTVASSFENKFIPKMSDFKKSITHKTKAILLNTPVNPTGVVWGRAELVELCEIVLDKDLYLISDEIYDHIVFDGREHISPLSFPGIKKRGILINGFSKTYAMTGWRLGYLCAEKMLSNHIIKIHQHTATCSPEFVQLAAIEALNKNKKIYIPYVNYYQKARNILFEAICRSLSLRAIKPEGTFYMLVDISKIAQDSNEAVSLLLERYKLATTPGLAYGKSASKTIRLSFAIPEEDLMKASNILSKI